MSCPTSWHSRPSLKTGPKGLRVLGMLVAALLVGILAGCEGCTKAKDVGAIPTAATPGAIPGSLVATPTDTVTTSDLKIGKGAEAMRGKQLSVLYTGQLADGKVIDSRRDARAPFEFELGAGTVIVGWDQGLVGMRVGGVRRLVIPPLLAYGSRAFAGVIPPNSTLTFEVELVKVQ
jgi:hypothetical protein